jgi:hypothetical protein
VLDRCADAQAKAGASRPLHRHLTARPALGPA